MESALPPPSPLILTGSSNAEQWKTWKQRFLLYLEATSIGKKEDKQKIAVLLHVIGIEGLQIYNTLGVSQTDTTTLQNVLDLFENYFVPKRNIPYERQKLFMIIQQPSQTIDEFVTELRQQLSNCEYGTLSDSILLDQLIRGIAEGTVRERLLRIADLNINKALDVCRASESAKLRAQVFDASVAKVDTVTPRWSAKGRGRRQRMGASSKMVGSAATCSRCARKHPKRECPAYNQVCRKCEKRNHFEVVCRTSPRRKVHELCRSEEEHDFIVGEVSSSSVTKSWNVKLEIKGTNVEFKIDTGAQVNILPIHVLNDLPCSVQISPSTCKLFSYTGDPVEVVGKCTLPCKMKNSSSTVNIDFIVVTGKNTPVLGLYTSANELNVIKRMDAVATQKANVVTTQKIDSGTTQKITPLQTILNEYKDTFEGIGEVPGEHEIVLKPNANPVITPARKIPFALMDKLELELQKMCKLKIIEKVTKPTDWVNPLVIVHKKNGTLRICLDPKYLNKSIMRSHYELPTFEQLVNQLSGAKHFTSLDASSAFWQLKLSPKSADLCTFSSPFGRFKFLRMPYGVSCAPEVYQRVVADIIEGIPKARNFFDDILIWGSTQKEHDEMLSKVLERCRSYNLKLNTEKSQINKTEIMFLGHKISQEGIEIDPKKVNSIVELPVPTNKKQLQRYLGMINYLTKFFPNMSAETKPLRELLRKNSDWVWDKLHTEIFESIKKKLTTTPVLSFFNKSESIEIEVDASTNGIGAVLLQKGQPVAFASCSLTSAQQRYAQIERELLAIVFGTRRFHQYVYGNPRVTVYTDHKPLVAMAQKPLYTLSARLQRLYLCLQQYDIQIKYRPGKEMYISDTLSRSPVQNETFKTPDEDTIVLAVDAIHRLTFNKFQEIASAVEKDAIFKEIQLFLDPKWKLKSKQISPEARKYLNCIADLRWVKLKGGGEILLKGDQVVIPKSLRKNILVKLHEGHFGQVKTVELAKSFMYWPGMTTEIKNYIKNCRVCAKFQKSNPSEPIKLHEIPPSPWVKLGLDFLYFKGDQYLLVVDYYSKYIELEKVKNTSALAVIPVLKSILARHGIPAELVTDGGPPFNSKEFANFKNHWQITHTIVSAKYPKANGQVERSIQTVKQIFRKTLDDSKDMYLALLLWRSVPLTGTVHSPAELLMGRKIATLIPGLVGKVKINTKQLNQRRKFDRKKIGNKFSKNKTLNPLRAGQKVFIQNKIREWEPAKIVKLENKPRSYCVQTEKGTFKTRNRVHIRPVPSPLPLPLTVYKSQQVPRKINTPQVLHRELTNSSDLTFKSNDPIEETPERNIRKTSESSPVRKGSESTSGARQDSDVLSSSSPHPVSPKSNSEPSPASSRQVLPTTPQKQSRYGRILKPPERYGNPVVFQ